MEIGIYPHLTEAQLVELKKILTQLLNDRDAINVRIYNQDRGSFRDLLVVRRQNLCRDIAAVQAMIKHCEAALNSSESLQPKRGRSKKAKSSEVIEIMSPIASDMHWSGFELNRFTMGKIISAYTDFVESYKFD